jgi:hypothetical protein
MNTPARRLALAFTAALAALLPAASHASIRSDDAANESARQAVGPQRGGVVDRFRIDPHGRVSGLILSNGTEIVVAGPRGQTLTALVRPGDRIRIPFGPSETVQIENERTGLYLPIGTVGSFARGGGPATDIPYAPIDDASRLHRITVRGHVHSMLSLPDGTPSGFVMQDGTQVHLLKRVAFAATKMISRGEPIVVEGRGTRSRMGTGLWAVKIMRPDRRVMLDLTRGIGAPELNIP